MMQVIKLYYISRVFFFGELITMIDYQDSISEAVCQTCYRLEGRYAASYGNFQVLSLAYAVLTADQGMIKVMRKGKEGIQNFCYLGRAYMKIFRWSRVWQILPCKLFP